MCKNAARAERLVECHVDHVGTPETDSVMSVMKLRSMGSCVICLKTFDSSFEVRKQRSHEYFFDVAILSKEKESGYEGFSSSSDLVVHSAQLT
jgi:hypothetical protein